VLTFYNDFYNIFTARCIIVQSAVLRSHVVCPSVTLVDHDHIGWKSWKLIARIISPTSSVFIAQRSSTYSQGNMEKFWGENVRSTPTSTTSGWIESTESHVILGGGVAVCFRLLLSVHRVVIFGIAHFLYLEPINAGASFPVQLIVAQYSSTREACLCTQWFRKCFDGLFLWGQWVTIFCRSVFPNFTCYRTSTSKLSKNLRKHFQAKLAYFQNIHINSSNILHNNKTKYCNLLFISDHKHACTVLKNQ